MTIKQAFAQFMQDNALGTRGTDIFLDVVPKEKKKKSAWWIVGGGGTPIAINKTGEKQKAYVLNIFFRDIDAQNVDEQLQSLEELVNNPECKSLPEYDTVEMTATGFQNNIDLDSEDRATGNVEVTVTVYQSA